MTQSVWIRTVIRKYVLMDFYVDEHGEVSVLLDWTGIIFFDFITPLDEYLLPGSKTRTIGDLYKEEKKC